MIYLFVTLFDVVIYRHIENDIIVFTYTCKVFITGDINSRIGQKTGLQYLPRTSCDLDLNCFGNRFLDLGNFTSFLVVIVSLLTDKDIGKLASKTSNGETVVDYLVTLTFKLPRF
jgi:hypothetical protein